MSSLVKCIAVAMLAVGILLATLQLPAQQPAGADSPNVIFGTVAADKGTVASVPVYLNVGRYGLRRLAVTLDFISNSVKFDRFDTSASSNEVDSKFSVEAEDLPPDSKRLPRTRLKLKAESSKGFTDGLLVFLNFKLAADAKPFAVSLQPTEIIAEDGKGKPAMPSIEAGKVIVSAEDEEVIGCFFFTH